MSVVRLDWVFAHDAIYFLHVTCSCIFVHCMFFFLLSCALKFLLCLCSSFCLSRLVISSWHPKSMFLLKTQFIVVLYLHLFLLIPFGSMMRRHKMTSLRTFLIGQFIRNARLFCLIFQTLLYPVCLALRDWFLYVRNSRGVPMCSYKSFTPIYTPSIPLSLSLLRYSEVHIS